MVETAPESLRERKKTATRGALRRAAVNLVASRGLSAVTVDDIASAAGVSVRTFFNYFPTKEDAISGLDPADLADLAGRLRSRPSDEAPQVALRATLMEALSGIEADHRDLAARLELVRSDPHLLARHASAWAETERQMVAALVERRGGDSGPDRYSTLVVATTLAAARVGLMSWCSKCASASLADELAYHFDLLASGLAEPSKAVTGR